MVKHFQKPASGHYRYSVWTIPDSAGKNTCLVLLCHKQNGAQESTRAQDKQPEHLLQAALCQHPEVTRMRAVYVPAVDLQHYGELDHLAPAGAMAEFVQHVQRQTLEEAAEAFAPLHPCLHEHALALEISVAPSLKKAQSLLRDLGVQAAD